MSNASLSLDDFTESIASLSSYQRSCFDDDGEYQRILKTLVRAVDGELTPRQRECVVCYYCHRMKISEIAKNLGIYPSTVSRHISKAKCRLETVIGYYFPKFL